MILSALDGIVAGVASAGIFEPKGAVACPGQPVGEDAKPAIGDEFIAQQARADQDRNVAHTPIDRRMQPPEAVVNRNRPHNTPYTPTSIARLPTATQMNAN